MKSVLCRSYGPPENLTLEEIDAPSPNDDQILIDVNAAGLNFPDTLQIAGKYQFQPPFPFVPGAELAGTVAAVGANAAAFKVGDRVMALPGIGALAELAVADTHDVFHVPEGMTMAEAAGFIMVYGTSYYALKQRAALQPGESLLVLGASGGVGLTAVELGKALGARVYAAASSKEKLAVARDAGADVLINYGTGDLKQQVKDLTQGEGCDVIYDPVGGDLFDQAARCIAWEGRYLVVGFASGRIPQLPANLILLKGCQYVGVFWGAFRRRDPQTHEQNFKALFDLYRAGKIHPRVGHTFRLDQYADALNVFVNRQAMGKVVVQIKQ
ncbi:MAG: NADPH:quinone oxidoreductase family protein [Candidatus Hydrogenedentales bacterium]